jgi:hypothetical protein
MPVPLQYPVLMPDTPSEIVAEIGNSRAMRRLKRELIIGAQFQQEFAILRQQRINEANRIIEHRVLEGVGEKVAEIDAELYWQMTYLYGEDCWSDPDFIEDTLAKNPGLRLRTRWVTRVRVDGFRQRSHNREGSDRRDAGAVGNRTGERIPGPFPDLVQGIEHPAVPSRVPGGFSEGAP